VTVADFDVIPVNVLTGFLGSGKTTLLRQLLSFDALGETAVLINEFGEIGIDHLLIARSRPTRSYSKVAAFAALFVVN
jgi:G3E family GTPase